MRGELEELSRQVNDRMEIIPGDQRSWVFIGKPPKRFGLAWIEGHEVKNLKSLAEEKKIGADRMTRIVEELREAYIHSDTETRFDTELGGKHVLVAPSPKLEHEVEEIIHRAEA